MIQTSCPPLLAAPWGGVNMSGLRDVFLSALMAAVKWFSWLHAVCGEGSHYRTEGCLPRGGTSALGDKDFPLSGLV